MTMRTQALRCALAATVAGLVVAVGAPAQATAYRYWSYWIAADGAWTYANAGPAYRVPADGTIEGWRFSVDAEGGGNPPRMSSDFETVCGSTPAEQGKKRVAVVVDPGVAEDAPSGESPPGVWALCVSAAPGATGYDVLRAATSVRVQGGLICGISGYPASECAIVVREPDPTPTKKPEPTPSADPTKKPEPTPTGKPTEQPEPTPTSAPSPSSAAPSTPTDPSPLEPATADNASATPTPDSTDEGGAETASASSSPTPSAQPTQPSQSPAAAVADTPVSPTPEVSLLAEPLPDATEGSGTGSALLTGGAVAGIALLGGAAAVITRRRSL